MNEHVRTQVRDAKAGKAIHPGEGRRKGLMTPKGRVLEATEVARLSAILGDRQPDRPLLIEYLHLIQDAEKCLPAGLMHALAEWLRIPMAEVFEVATFYAHFDVVPDGAACPAKVTIRVCDSLSCMMAGADALLLTLQKEKMDDVRVVRAPCIGSCHTAPAVEVGHHHVDHATAAKVKALALAGETHAAIPAYQDFSAYQSSGARSTIGMRPSVIRPPRRGALPL